MSMPGYNSLSGCKLRMPNFCPTYAGQTTRKTRCRCWGSNQELLWGNAPFVLGNTISVLMGVTTW